MSEKVGHALYVPEAVCYHNNPESFNEIYEHEKRIGESLVAKGKLGEYLQKYKFLLSLFGLCVLIAITLAIYLEISFITLLLTIVCILAFLIMAVSINRAISERYVSHLIYVPAVMVTR